LSFPAWHQFYFDNPSTHTSRKGSRHGEENRFKQVESDLSRIAVGSVTLAMFDAAAVMLFCESGRRINQLPL
jgi:hypothetical protein